jgi:hypothetical protein
MNSRSRGVGSARKSGESSSCQQGVKMTTDLFLSSLRARRGQCCYPSDPGGEKASPARREGRRRGDEQRAAARGREAGWWSSWEAGSSFSRRKGSSGRSRAAGRCLCVRRSMSRMEVMAAGGGGEKAEPYFARLSFGWGGEDGFERRLLTGYRSTHTQRRDPQLAVFFSSEIGKRNASACWVDSDQISREMDKQRAPNPNRTRIRSPRTKHGSIQASQGSVPAISRPGGSPLPRSASG